MLGALGSLISPSHITEMVYGKIEIIIQSQATRKGVTKEEIYIALQVENGAIRMMVYTQKAGEAPVYSHDVNAKELQEILK